MGHGEKRPEHARPTGIESTLPRAPRLPQNRFTGTLSPEMIDGCIEVARDLDPALADRMAAQRGENFTELEQLIRHKGRRLLDLWQLKQRDESLYELKVLELKTDAEVVEVAAALRSARAEGNVQESTRLEQELRILLRMQMAFALKAREDYICRLKEHIERLEDELQDDYVNFDERVELRLRQLTGSAGHGTGQPTGGEREPPE